MKRKLLHPTFLPMFCDGTEIKIAQLFVLYENAKLFQKSNIQKKIDSTII